MIQLPPLGDMPPVLRMPGELCRKILRAWYGEPYVIEADCWGLQRLVLDFHRTKGGDFNLIGPTPLNDYQKLRRCRLITEEAAEYVAACSRGDFVGQVDALADLLYVVYGTAVEMGVLLDPIVEEVHRSNMTKTLGGKDESGKIQKGPNYEPPDIHAELVRQGWKVYR